MKKTAIAIASHPDDIEFMMAGTLIRLKEAGYEIHYLNIANGSLGSAAMDRDETVATRRREAMDAARLLGAAYHESLCDDLEVFYNSALLAGVVEVVREVEPEIVLTHGPYDYMEDHVNAGRLAVSAAFCRGMRNFKCAPSAKPVSRAVAVYHAMPHSITDQLCRSVTADFYVDIAAQMEEKRRALACHKSQKEWLDVSQGLNAYLEEMDRRAVMFGRKSGVFEFAEGWIRHNPLGLCPEDFNPLPEIVSAKYNQE